MYWSYSSIFFLLFFVFLWKNIIGCPAKTRGQQQEFVSTTTFLFTQDPCFCNSILFSICSENVGQDHVCIVAVLDQDAFSVSNAFLVKLSTVRYSKLCKN